MSSILSMARESLTLENFALRDLSLDGEQRALLFEDPTVLGFVVTYENPSSLIEEWQSTAHLVTRLHAQLLAAAGNKAWNTYLVLLASQEADFGQTLALGQIEENLQGMRKIARAGISGLDAVNSALLPLLPFRSSPSLEPINMPKEISARATEISTAVVEAFLSNADESVVLTIVEDQA